MTDPGLGDVFKTEPTPMSDTQFKMLSDERIRRARYSAIAFTVMIVSLAALVAVGIIAIAGGFSG